VLILVIGVVDIGTHAHTRAFPGSPWPHVGFLVPAVALLGVRRRAPILAPMAALVVATLWGAILWAPTEQGSFEAFLVFVAAAYCIASANRGRRLLIGSGLIAAYFLICEALSSTRGTAGDFVPVLAWMSMAWAVGLVLNRRKDEAHAARQHAATVVAEQERRTAEAIAHERSRIARELHDVVAHSLSVVVVQAAAERRALRSGTADAESTDSVLASVERTGREALVELRRLLGLLRATEEPPSLAPQPSLSELDTLLQPVRDAGLTVHVERDEQIPQLPAGVDLSAYRIVQEALTNVLKHAQASEVTVGVHFRRGQLTVEVTDNGHGAPHRQVGVQGGHGLVGMRERVAVYDGSLSAGPAPDAGWSVRAQLSVDAPAMEPA
jgi:signal transduction histidine kinase